MRKMHKGEATAQPADALVFLDFVRAIAVSLVLIDHVCVYLGHKVLFDKFDIWRIGKLGVSFFFVHTFFVLAMSLERTANEPRAYVKFVVRRVFRIFPLPVAVMAIMLIGQIPTTYLDFSRPFSFTSHSLSPFEIGLNFLLINNFVKDAYILELMWSICMEFQMYLILPFLVLFSRKASPWVLLGVLALSLGLAWATERPINELNKSLTYLQLPNYLVWFPPLFAGLMAFLIRKRVKPFLPPWTIFIWITIPIVLNFYSYRTAWTASMAVLMACALPWIRDFSPWSGFKLISWVVQYSFGLFVCQYIAIWLCLRQDSSLPLIVQLAGFVLCLGLMSVLFYHLIEKPCIQLGKRLAERL